MLELLERSDSTAATALLERAGIDRARLDQRIARFVPKSSFPYRTRSSFRLTESWRSVCIPLAGDLHLIIKGSEALSPDIDACYRQLFRTCHQLGSPTNAQHFFHKEGKIPLMLTHSEAWQEFATAKAMSDDYLEAYGRLPHLPVPLSIHRIAATAWEADALRTFAEHLRSDLGVALEEVDLTALAYLLRGRPGRIKTWKEYVEYAKLPRALWRQVAEADFDSQEVFRGLVQLFVDLSDRGWVLAPPGQDHLGYSVKAQNVTLGGGIVDVGNAYRIGSTLRHDDAAGFLLSLHHLSLALGDLLAPSGRMRPELGSLLMGNLLIRAIGAEWCERDSNSLLFRLFSDLFLAGEISLSRRLDDLLGDDLRENLRWII